jgi:hypothetical protein
MEFAHSCIKVLPAIALFAMGVHFAPVQAAVSNAPVSVSAALDGAHREDTVTPVKQTSARELGLSKKQDCPPVCPTGTIIHPRPTAVAQACWPLPRWLSL